MFQNNQDDIHAVVSMNNVKKMVSFIEQGGDVNAKNLSGNSILEVAIQQANESIVKLLIDAGAVVNRQELDEAIKYVELAKEGSVSYYPAEKALKTLGYKNDPNEILKMVLGVKLADYYLFGFKTDGGYSLNDYRELNVIDKSTINNKIFESRLITGLSNIMDGKTIQEQKIIHQDMINTIDRFFLHNEELKVEAKGLLDDYMNRDQLAEFVNEFAAEIFRLEGQSDNLMGSLTLHDLVRFAKDRGDKTIDSYITSLGNENWEDGVKILVNYYKEQDSELDEKIIAYLEATEEEDLSALNLLKDTIDRISLKYFNDFMSSEDVTKLKNLPEGMLHQLLIVSPRAYKEKIEKIILAQVDEANNETSVIALDSGAAAEEVDDEVDTAGLETDFNNVDFG